MRGAALVGFLVLVVAMPSAGAVAASADVRPERLDMGTVSSIEFAVHFEASTRCPERAEEPITFRLSDPLVHVVRFEQTTVTLEWREEDGKWPRWVAEGTYWFEVRRATASAFSERTHWTTPVGPGSDSCTDQRESRTLDSQPFAVTGESRWNEEHLEWLGPTSPAALSVGLLAAAATGSAAVAGFVVLRARRGPLE